MYLQMWLSFDVIFCESHPPKSIPIQYAVQPWSGSYIISYIIAEYTWQTWRDYLLQLKNNKVFTEKEKCRQDKIVMCLTRLQGNKNSLLHLSLFIDEIEYNLLDVDRSGVQRRSVNCIKICVRKFPKVLWKIRNIQPTMNIYLTQLGGKPQNCELWNHSL